MTEAEFNGLAAQGYNRIPVVLETFADLDTPLSVYLKLANRSYSYLLESVQGGERFGRYSFIGLPAVDPYRGARQPYQRYQCSEGRKSRSDDPLAFIESYLSRFKVAPYPGLPRFCGGLVGYFGYDAVRYIERKLAGHAHCPIHSIRPISCYCCRKSWRWWIIFPANSTLSFMRIRAGTDGAAYSKAAKNA